MLIQTNKTKMSKAEEEAYKLVDGTFMAMMGAAIKYNLDPKLLWAPWLQKGAAMCATATMMGAPNDLEKIAADFKNEYRAALRQALGAVPGGETAGNA